MEPTFCCAKFYHKTHQFFQIMGARSYVSGDSAISTISVTLDRNLNNHKIKCEAMNAALDEPMVDFKQFSVLCKVLYFGHFNAF